MRSIMLYSLCEKGTGLKPRLSRGHSMVQRKTICIKQALGWTAQKHRIW